MNGICANINLDPIQWRKGRNPHKRTSWKLVGNPGCELVAN